MYLVLCHEGMCRSAFAGVNETDAIEGMIGHMMVEHNKALKEAENGIKKNQIYRQAYA